MNFLIVLKDHIYAFMKFEVTKMNMNCLHIGYGTTLEMVGFQWCNSKDPLIVNLKVVLHCKHPAINLYKMPI